MKVGEYEYRTDLPPIRKRGKFGEYLAHMLDRRIFETWQQDGQKWGRWTWESGL